MSDKGFLPKKGNYKKLLSYQKSVIIYDCTFVFCKRFFNRRDRTVDQMVQAARSGKQNIIEGSRAALTSTGTELKLTNVARASLEELLEDYHDFIRVRNFTLWLKDSKEAGYVRNLSSGKIPLPKLADSESRPHKSHSSHKSHTNPKTDTLNEELLRRTFVHFLESRPPDVCANIMICLVNQCNFLLNRQIRKLEKEFTKEGGLRERMYNARISYRKDRFR
jgi:four helix bundle suffix protein